MLTKQFFAALRLPITVIVPGQSSGTVRERQITLYPQGMSQGAVDGFNMLCTEWERLKIPDIDSLAYIMATAMRECGPSLDLGISEIGRGVGKAYGKPDGPCGLIYYGRGFPQWTWYSNYVKADALMKTAGLPAADFARNPERMCDPKYSVPLAFQGFFKGTWTGVGLRHYITPGVDTSYPNFYGARHVVNGTDHADEIACNALALRSALKNGGVLTQIEHALAPTVRSSPTSNPAAMQPPKRGFIWELGRLFGVKS